MNDAAYLIEADEQANRLYITLEGTLDESMAERVIEDIDEETGKLNDGFDIVTDISAYDPQGEVVSEYIDIGKELVDDRGASAVAYVTPMSGRATDEFIDTLSEQIDYDIHRAPSRERAEEVLEFIGSFDGE